MGEERREEANKRTRTGKEKPNQSMEKKEISSSDDIRKKNVDFARGKREERAV